MMSAASQGASAPRPFLALAHGLCAFGWAVNCDESCAHVHDGHGCAHEGHACGCPHSASYDFEFDLPEPERWAADLIARLASFTARLDLPSLSVAQIEEALEHWWRGENRALRRAMEKAHRTRCLRGRGVLVQRSSSTYYPAPCKDWRNCGACARSYGMALERRWSRVTGLQAFVVLTMPPALGDWRRAENRAAMMSAWHRLAERVFRKVRRRPKLMHFKEHAGAAGRLHLNVLWDVEWLDQGWLSSAAAAAGFGPVCHISRIGARAAELLAGRPGCSPAVRYSMKGGRACFRVRAYARKTGSQTAAAGDDWPKHTRRWSASRAASREMGGPRERNPDWYWALAPPLPGDLVQPARAYWLLPETYLPVRATTERAPAPLTFSRPPPALLFLPFRSGL